MKYVELSVYLDIVNDPRSGRGMTIRRCLLLCERIPHQAGLV
jgi:hypothetical protein